MCYTAVKITSRWLLTCWCLYISETGFFGLPGRTLAIVVGTVSGAAICMGVLLGSFLYVRNRRHRISKGMIFSSNSACNGSLDQGELKPLCSILLFHIATLQICEECFYLHTEKCQFGNYIWFDNQDIQYECLIFASLYCCFICLMNIGTSAAEFVVGHLNLIVNVHRVSSLTFWAVNSLSCKKKGFFLLICIVLNINSATKNYTYCLNSSQKLTTKFLSYYWWYCGVFRW